MSMEEGMAWCVVVVLGEDDGEEEVPWVGCVWPEGVVLREGDCVGGEDGGSEGEEKEGEVWSDTGMIGVIVISTAGKIGYGQARGCAR